jgi:methionine synthase II (cobalamin-independent)
MAEEVSVDLDELEKTVSALNQVLSGLGKANTDAATNTYLPAGALGTGFDEADKLANAHNEIKTYIEDAVRYLNSVMDEFGRKTKYTHGAYQDTDYEAKASFPNAGQ